MICIIDYGLGNLAAIHNMLRRLEIPSKISGAIEDIESADRLILPGVGAFDSGMRGLSESGLIGPLTKQVTERHKPILGICLGMQLLGEGSEEGNSPGLGWLKMRFERFPRLQGSRTKRLHMGWNEIAPAYESPLLAGYERTPRFYFVHGYHAVCDDESDVLARSTYAVTFPSMVARGNIYGAQFHPEKSHKFGMQLFRNFSTVS